MLRKWSVYRKEKPANRMNLVSGNRGYNSRVRPGGVGMRSLPGNPYAVHTLTEAIEQITILTSRP